MDFNEFKVRPTVELRHLNAKIDSRIGVIRFEWIFPLIDLIRAIRCRIDSKIEESVIYRFARVCWKNSQSFETKLGRIVDYDPIIFLYGTKTIQVVVYWFN